MDSLAGGSPRQLARIAGALYLINIVGGAFAITIVPAMLVVQGNVAATAQNIQTHELLYRVRARGARCGHRDQCPPGGDLLRAVQSGEPKARPAGRLLHPGRDRH
jgi:uncharacterized protein DUF4386